MKTTIDLPEDLIREMKFRAVREGRKLREVAEVVFRRGLAAPAPARSTGERHRVKLPIVPAPAGSKPFQLSGKRLLELERDAEGLDPVWRQLAVRESPSPKVWMDADLAAFAITGSLRLVTLDKDFRNHVPSGLDLLLLKA